MMRSRETRYLSLMLIPLYCPKNEVAATYVDIYESSKLLVMEWNDGTQGVDHLLGEIS